MGGWTAWSYPPSRTVARAGTARSLRCGAATTPQPPRQPAAHPNARQVPADATLDGLRAAVAAQAGVAVDALSRDGALLAAG